MMPRKNAHPHKPVKKMRTILRARRDNGERGERLLRAYHLFERRSAFFDIGACGVCESEEDLLERLRRHLHHGVHSDGRGQ